MATALGSFTRVAGGLGKTEGPVWHEGTLWVVSMDQGVLHEVARGQRTSHSCGGGPNGAARRGDGAVVVAQNGGLWGGKPATPGIQMYRDGAWSYLLELDQSAAPNDLAFAPDGRLWFTDPGREGKPRDPEDRRGRVWSCAADGSGARVELTGLAFGNGLAFSADGGTLFVTETATRNVLRVPLGSSAPRAPTVLATLPDGLPDGLALDEGGHLWVAGSVADRLYVFDRAGALVDTLVTPPGSRPTNCCFGGEGRHQLFVTTSGAGEIVQILTRATGISLFDGSKETRP